MADFDDDSPNFSLKKVNVSSFYHTCISIQEQFKGTLGMNFGLQVTFVVVLYNIQSTFSNWYNCRIFGKYLNCCHLQGNVRGLTYMYVTHRGPPVGSRGLGSPFPDLCLGWAAFCGYRWPLLFFSSGCCPPFSNTKYILMLSAFWPCGWNPLDVRPWVMLIVIFSCRCSVFLEHGPQHSNRLTYVQWNFYI